MLIGSAAAQAPSRDFRSVRPAVRVNRVIDDSVTVLRPGNRHPLARAEFDTGSAPADTQMDRMILLLQADQAQKEALEALLEAQQDPQSPEYQRWLTPEDFGQRFGVSDSDLQQIVQWLTSHGFQVEPPAAARRQIVFSGTAGQVRTAFHTEVHIYNVNGQRHYANALDPQIPEALAEVVAGVVSLHDFHSAPAHQLAGQVPSASPNFNSGSSHYMAPADFAIIYDVAGLYSQSINGSGQSVAVAGRSNLSPSDVQSFRTQFGLPVNNPTVVLNGPDPGVIAGGEQGEATLDVEWAGATAPKASVQFVVSASTSASDGIALSSEYIVNHNLAPVMTLSFGSCEAGLGASGNQFWNSLWQQAAAQGMTVFVSAGDSGAAGCDDPSSGTATGGAGVNGLCSSPYSTCVGGTQFADIANPSAYWSASSNAATYASALSYIPEAAWNQSGTTAGVAAVGCGRRRKPGVFKPSWQTGPGVPADGHRDVPDLSLTASTHDGYLVAMNGELYVYGGTSAPTPSLAGLMALAVQKAGTRLGNANPGLYAMAVKQANAGAAVFHDVTSGNNSVPGQAGFNAAAGYDLATGLGSVDATLLVNHWGDATTPTPSFQLSAGVSSLSLTQGSSGAITLNVAVSGGFNSTVTLSAGALPSGLTASFTPASLAAPGSGASSLKISSTASTAPGAYNLSLTATGGSLTQTAPLAVTIRANCSYAVTPLSANATAAGGSFSLTVTAQTGCSWTAASNASWITLASGNSGKGNGRVSYSVAANNTTSARTGSITVGGATVAITQAAAGSSYSLNPTSASFPAAGGSGSVAISVSPSGASWTATSTASWITLANGYSGNGNGRVSYSVAANNTTSARTGSIAVGGATVAITQAAASSSYSLNPTSASFPAAGGSGSVVVSVSPSGASWTATSTAGWITLASGYSGNGNGRVSYSVAANNTTSARTGSIAVGSATVAITQAAASSSYSLNPTSASFPAAGGSGSVAISVSPSGASWTATSNASWITITSAKSGTGNGRLSYSVAANNIAAARTGSIAAGNATLAITQAAASSSYSLNPTSASFPAAGGSGSVVVSVSPSGASWTATSNASWIAIAGPKSGAGKATLAYSVASNSAGARSGTLTIAGLTFTVAQAQAPLACSYQIALGPITSAKQGFIGSVSVATSPGCQWTAASTASWLSITSGANGSGNGVATYLAAPNASSSPRTGSLVVAGYTSNLTESGVNSRSAVRAGVPQHR